METPRNSMILPRHDRTHDTAYHRVRLCSSFSGRHTPTAQPNDFKAVLHLTTTVCSSEMRELISLRITLTKMNMQGRGCMQDYVEVLRISGAGPGWCRPVHKCQLQLILPKLEVVQVTASFPNYGMPKAAFPKINRLLAGME